MLDNRRRIYILGTYTVERRGGAWHSKKTYGSDDRRGPSSPEMSVCLMIARQLTRELVKRGGASPMNYGPPPCRSTKPDKPLTIPMLSTLGLFGVLFHVVYPR